jgi:hypothetical protein
MTHTDFLPCGLHVRLASLPLILAIALSIASAGQHGRLPSPGDPCGAPDTTTAAYRLAATLNWGYGYDSLRADLIRWSASPFVHIDSIGASVQNRAIYRLTIEDTATAPTPRKRIWIHARTHPIEVQGTWVTNQVIAQLLGSSPFARQLREACVFSIVPMINPDGVELKLPRENAHNIDIESNWTAVPGEPEVQTLRRTFVSLMAQSNPILLALNVHSAYGTDRYFVYHTATGTSSQYAATEQHFINSVRSFFPGGIRPFDFFVSWTTAPSLVYPESWFWQNCRENVLALTYEDMNDASARAFDSTANAILRGLADQLGVNATNGVAQQVDYPGLFSLEQNYPNPFNPSTTIGYTVSGTGSGKAGSGVSGLGSGVVNRQLSTVNSQAGAGSAWVRLAVYDVLGREVAVLVNEKQDAGTYKVAFDGSRRASGVYLYRLQINSLDHSPGGASGSPEPDFVQTRRLLLLK